VTAFPIAPILAADAVARLARVEPRS
jgi:hypothetical protein